MNTQNTFVRFSQEDGSQETFISIAESFYSGIPIDENTGDDLTPDEELYRMVSPNKYEKIA